MSAQVTRELLEHYLRATGWKRDANGFWHHGGWQVGTFEGMTVYAIQHEIGLMASKEQCTSVDLAYRLGVVGAAEHSREATAFAPAKRFDALTERYMAHIAFADLTVEQWEAARKT